ncbi:MAG: SusC/RagA family TonB-linked outer membrane protein, partial [Ignavibacterium sp.]
MVSETIGLGEVVVVGYGTQKSSKITGAVSTVDSRALQDAPVSQLTQMLQGKLSGVRIQQASGRPGEGMKIQVRGAVSLTAGSNPLYVVDGMPIVGDISFLSPDEIESITILKDPSSASLYGSRSSNGVILIQTKSGLVGKPKVEFSAFYGYEYVPENRRFKMMNAKEWAQFQKEIAETNGRPVNPVFQNPEQYDKGTDWFDVVTRVGAIQKYNLTLSGGSERLKVISTMGYFNQEGVIVETGYQRYSFRVNSIFQANEKLSIGINMAPTFTTNNNFNTDGWPYVTENIVSSALITTPLSKPYNEDGTLSLWAVDPATFPNPNWLRVAKEKVYENKNVGLLLNGFVQYKPVNGLIAKSTFNVQSGYNTIFEFNPSTIGRLFVPPPQTPYGSDSRSQFLNLVNENTLTYQRVLGNHNIDALIGFTAQQYHSEGNIIYAYNFADDKIMVPSAAGRTQIISNIQDWTLASFLARINYDLKEKYLLSASIRRDGSSRFGEMNRWGNFPAISFGWIISKEDFWNLKPVSLLKVRGSYGITGNFEIGNYSHLSTFKDYYYPFNNTSFTGRAPNNLGDRALRWEKNIQYNIGADIYLFANRLQFSYNYYTRITKDLLFNVDVPLSSGFSNLQTNAGKLKFWGHEFELISSIVINSNVNWKSSLNISFDRNRTESLTTQSGFLPGGILLYQYYSHRTVVGEPIAMFYGAVHEGVYKNQEDFNSSPKFVDSAVGTAKFKDLNGDGIITFPEDMTLIGSPWPKFIFGMTQYFSYKNFDLSLLINGAYGNKILAFYQNWMANLDGVFNVLADVKNRWKSEAEPGNGQWGSVKAGTTYVERDRWSTLFLKDGSYISMKNIALGYTPKWKNLNLHFYISIQNVFLLTKYPGPNPEVDAQATQTSTPLGTLSTT